jgi:hypothetical protein
LPESVKKALDHVVTVASVAVLLSLAYILFVTLSNGLAAPLIGGSALEQVTRSLGLARNVLLWGLWLALAAAMIRHHQTESMGWITMVAGAACWGVLPWVIGSRMNVATAQPLMELGQSLISSFQSGGGALIVFGFLRVAAGRIMGLVSVGRGGSLSGLSSGQAAAIAAERAAERPSLMRRCWELHFCRSGLRSNCPRFLGGVSCWKKKSGCYCDDGLATQLLSGMGANARAKVAEELQSAQRRPRARRQKKEARCGECPVYLEHQKYKYRALSWAAYPLSAAVVGFGAAGIINAYYWVDSRLGTALDKFQILPHSLTNAPLDQASWLSAPNVTVVVVGILVLGIILQLTEVAVFRLKL